MRKLRAFEENHVESSVTQVQERTSFWLRGVRLMALCSEG